MNCYTAVKMHKIQLHATTWITVSDIMLSEKASLRRLHQLCYLSKKWKIKTMNSLQLRQIFMQGDHTISDSHYLKSATGRWVKGREHIRSLSDWKCS